MITKNCEYCSKMFVAKNDKCLCCSKKCHGRKTSKKIHCLTCDKFLYNNDFETNQFKFCSQECYDNYNPQDIEIKTCPRCNKDFHTLKKLNQEFCSGYCAKTKLYSRVTLECPICHKIFKRKKSQLSSCNCCSSKCANEFIKAKNEVSRKLLLPSIIEFYENHTMQETADKFESHLSTISNLLRSNGVYSDATNKRNNCPNELSKEQQEYMVGNLLGDGSICYLKLGTGYNTCFRLTQNIKNKEYLEGLFGIYSPFSSRIHYKKTRKPSKVDGKISHDIKYWNGEYTESGQIYTICHPIFTELRKKWYQDPYAKRSQKIVPKDMRLTWRAAAVWACDDGSNYCDTYQRSLVLYTDSFSKDTVEYLIERIKLDLNIHSTIQKRLENYLIRIGSDEWFKFIEQIKPYIPWQCLQYKCRNRLKTSGDNSSILEFLKSIEKQN